MVKAQDDLFSGAQFANDELRGIAQKVLRNSNFSLTQGELRKGRANRPTGIGANCARAIPPGLFVASDDARASLELELRQTSVALQEKADELVAWQAEQAPWWDLHREACNHHARVVEEQGFRIGGDQAAARLAYIARLDAIREQLRPAFLNANRLNGEVRSLRARLRGLETELKIITQKQKRKGTA